MDPLPTSYIMKTGDLPVASATDEPCRCEYEICIDSTLEVGSLSYGEWLFLAQRTGKFSSPLTFAILVV